MLCLMLFHSMLIDRPPGIQMWTGAAGSALLHTRGINKILTPPPDAFSYMKGQNMTALYFIPLFLPTHSDITCLQTGAILALRPPESSVWSPPASL